MNNGKITPGKRIQICDPTSHFNEEEEVGEGSTPNYIDPNYLDRHTAKRLIKGIALTQTSPTNIAFLEDLFKQINIALDFGCHIDMNGVIHSPHRHYKVADICLGLSEIRVHNFIKSLIDDCLENFEEP